jgi:thymidylate kinase
MNSKILLIEGVPGAGKTTLIKALLKEFASYDKRMDSLLYLSQSHTYKPIVSDEDNFYAGKADTLNHLSKILDLIRTTVCIRKDKVDTKLSVIIDTLHITLCFRPGNISWREVAAYDKHLAEMNCRLVFIKALPETIWERAILKRSAADTLYLSKYQKKYGKTLEQVHQYYMNEQEKMLQIITKSALQQITIFSEETIEVNKNIVFGFWQQ